MATVYRFKVGGDVSDILQRFALIHMNDEIDDYQDAWDQFLEDNSELLQRERELHENKGFNGDFNHKIYISTRYYHRKKLAGENQGIQEIQPDEHNEEGQKRAYNKVQGDVLKTIDEFLAEGAGALKPSVAWEQFCTEHGDELCAKKTFKNRIYQYKQKNMAQ